MDVLDDAERLAGLYREMLSIASRQRELAGAGETGAMEAGSRDRSALEAEIESLMGRIGGYPEEQRMTAGVASFITEAVRLAGETLEADRSTMSVLEKRRADLAEKMKANGECRVAMQGYRSVLTPSKTTIPRFIDKSR